MKNQLPKALLAALALGLLVHHAAAATDTWTGGAGGDGNWSNGANWGGSAPNPGDQLLFDGNPPTSPTNDFGPGTIFQELDFSASAGAFSIWGNSLVLTNGLDLGGGVGAGGSITNLSGNAQTINLQITLSAGRHNIANSGPLNLNGSITRNPGAEVVFGTSGTINAVNALSTINGIFGGWATIGSDWATLDVNGNVIAYNGYTNIASGTLSSVPLGTNVKYTGDTANIAGANGTSINSLVAANTAANRTLTETGVLKLGSQAGIFRNGATTGNTNFTVTGGFIIANGGGEISLSDAPFMATTDNLIVSSTISNDGPNVVSVNILGYVTLSGGNLYSGGTYINQGRASAGVTNSFGRGPVYVYPSGQAFLSGSVNYTNSFFISGIGPTETSGGQNLGAIRMNTGATIISGPITLLGNARISSGSGAVNTITGKITGPGRLEFTSATGPNNSIMLNNTNNDWSGGLLITAGGTTNRDVYVKLAASGQIPDGPGKGDVTINGSHGTARFDLNGFSETINGLNSAVSLSNQVANFGTAPSTLTLGNNDANGTFGGTIGGDTRPNTLSLVKIGAGTQILSSTNTYFGNTTISNGVLALSGAAPIVNSPLILVNSGATFDVSQSANKFTLGAAQAQTLGGNGVVTGSVVAVSKATISPGFSPGSLSFSNDLTLNACTNFLELSASTAGANDQIIVAGNLILSNLVTVLVNPYAGTLQSGRYKLILYGGALTGANSNLVLGGIATNATRQSFSLDTSIPNEVDLVVGGSVAGLVWKGDGGVNNWDTSSSNWLNGVAVDHFFNNDGVTFNDTGSENPAVPVHLVGALAPSSILVTNTGNYTLTGTGNLTGSTTTVTKLGSGTLALLETGGDNFGGGITVAAGTLVLSNASMNISGGLTVNGGAANLLGNGALGGGVTVNGGSALLDGIAALTGGASIASGGSLQVGNNDASGSLPSGSVTMNGNLLFNQTTNVVVTNVIGGASTGILTKNGANILTLGAASTFSGSVVVQTGTLRVTNNASLGATNGATTVAAGATLDVAGPAADNVLNLGLEPVTVSGMGVGNNGAIVNNGGNSQQNALRLVTLADHTWFGGSNRWDIRAAGGTTGDPSGAALNTGHMPYNLTKIGSNFVGIVSATVDTALANIDVQGGTLDLEGNTTSLGDSTKTITVFSNAILFFYRSTNLWNKLFVLKDGATIENNSQTNILIGPITLSTNAAGAPGNCTFNIGGNWMSISNVISGPGKLSKNGGSTLYLAATNTYTGNTLINTGSLALVGNGSISTTTNIILAAAGTLDATALSGQNFTLAAGQTLQGNGTNNGSLIVASGSTVMAGTNLATVGKLTVKGTLHLMGTNHIKIDKSNPQTNDQIAASIVSYEGGVLDLVNIGATPLVGGDTLTLFRGVNFFNGSSFVINPPTPGSGLLWNTNNLTVDGTLQVVAVPRPGISSITVAGTNVILRGTNATPTNATYYILSSTNPTVPLANWTRLATNQFLNDGTFTFTNAASIPQRFYLLQVP